MKKRALAPENDWYYNNYIMRLLIVEDENDYDFSSYENDIRKITKKVNNAKTSSNASENHKHFYTLKKQIDAVDDELDKLDDEF